MVKAKIESLSVKVSSSLGVSVLRGYASEIAHRDSRRCPSCRGVHLTGVRLIEIIL